ncbi:GDSL-type esterase/lipase family protein [Corynebacterium coyleae]|uniref:GDSL-type esterase/lipase family protein n=1 Tax=Corynebacterium TaxID=1716 RepID=UPI0008A1F52F|nr:MULTISPECIES: GDSL-type esterase/lipase family protein [Corynebacterium]OFU52285.1 hydrolase [Corynebacterium sp. HMSC11D10]
MSVFRRLAAAFVAAAALVAPLTPAAHAQERNMVIFGDSVISDPNMGQWAAGKLGLDPRGRSDNGSWCPTSATNWGKRSAAKLGLPARDYSCTGVVTISKGPGFFQQVDRAIADRGLSPATARVIISVGFNDTYNNNSRPDADIRRDFTRYMVPQINRIRAAAPNARIQIVGYPKVTAGDRVCLFHIAPNASDWTRFQEVQRWENLAQWMQVDAARAARVEFLDLKPSTMNNNMCAPDNQRMWAGLVDFYGGPGNLPIHVNQRGHEHVANIIARS